MIFTIGDPVRLAGTIYKRKFAARLAVFIGCVIGSATGLALILSIIGGAVVHRDIGVWILLGVGVIFVVFREALFQHLPIPQRTWQLPRYWLRAFWRGAALFGGVMGAGIFTFTPSALFYVYLAGCMLTANLRYAALMGLSYGLWFGGGVVYATMSWHDAEAGGQAARARTVLRRARLAGLPAVPLLLLFPSVWPFG